MRGTIVYVFVIVPLYVCMLPQNCSLTLRMAGDCVAVDDDLLQRTFAPSYVVVCSLDIRHITRHTIETTRETCAKCLSLHVQLDEIYNISHRHTAIMICHLTWRRRRRRPE